MARRIAYDRWMFFTASLLAVGGLLMVGSASNYRAMEEGRSPSAYYVKHLVHLALGFGVLFATVKLRYQALADRRMVAVLVLVCLVLLVFVLTMPPAGGARRWIPVGPFKFQPSEFAKLLAVVFMASVLSRKEDQVNDLWRTLAPSLAVVGLLALLVAIEPDLGSAVMLCIAACTMLFAAGLAWRFVAAGGLLGALGIALGIWAEPYRMERIRGFLDPTANALGSRFQLNQSLIAIGSGGWTGVGLGQGQQKAFFVPAVHTDFIFSVIGEELGLIGTATLLFAFLLLFWRGIRAAVGAPDRFGYYLALGLTTLLVVQGLVNMGVCTGLLPTKGLPLPFISYGGSSLLASMAALGLLLNVSQHSN